MGIVLLLALGLAAPQDLEGLLEKLKSDDPADRAAAARILRDRGPSTLSALKPYLREGDDGFRSEVKAVIGEIERRERIRIVRPPLQRLTLSLRDVPASEAVEKLLGTFGFDASFKGDHRVTVELDSVPVWEAFDALEKQGGIALEHPMFPQSGAAIYGHELRFVPGTGRPFPFARHLNVGDIRLYAAPARFQGKDDVGLRVWYVLPPGAVPDRIEIEDAELTDDRGRRLELPLLDPRLGRAQHRLGSISSEWLLTTNDAPFTRRRLEGASSLTLKATLVASWPRDLERFEAPLENLKGVTPLKAAGAVLEISFDFQPGGSILGNYRVRSAPDGSQDILWLWLEDEQGRRLVDLPRLAAGSLNPGASVGTSVDPFKAPPKKVAAARILGIDRVRTPVVIKDIPIPPVERK